MDIWLVTMLLLLLVTANGAPVVTSSLLGTRWSWPLDCHVRFIDRHPLLGATKTFRGVVVAIIATAVVAPLLGMAWTTGACFGLLAMLGDLSSSFIKRRFGLPSSRSVPLLDQLPESIFPIWMIQPLLGSTGMEMLIAVSAFVVIDLLLSPLLNSTPGR